MYYTQSYKLKKSYKKLLMCNTLHVECKSTHMIKKVRNRMRVRFKGTYFAVDVQNNLHSTTFSKFGRMVGLVKGKNHNNRNYFYIRRRRPLKQNKIDALCALSHSILIFKMYHVT